MANRKDSKGRCLRLGEVERKDGLYQYAYSDLNRKRRYVYAHSLKELRQKEDAIKRDLYTGIDPVTSNKMIVQELFEMYMDTKTNLSISTRRNYRYLYYHLVDPILGQRKISEIRYSVMLIFFARLSSDICCGTAHIIYSFMKPMFELLVFDDVLRKNPVTGVLREISTDRFKAKRRRVSLRGYEQSALMKYVKENKKYSKYYNLLVVFLGTGLRAGEVFGLTWNDINFDENLISINHSLSYICGQKDRSNFSCGSTKTYSSMREIPMFTQVREALINEKIRTSGMPCRCSIDGYTNFVFLNRNGKPLYAAHINRVLRRLVDDYNKERSEHFPYISMHNFRHTFATNLCMNESNLKVIQTIMGHSDINMTMNVYAECKKNRLQDVVDRLDKVMEIGYVD